MLSCSQTQKQILLKTAGFLGCSSNETSATSAEIRSSDIIQTSQHVSVWAKGGGKKKEKMFSSGVGRLL